MLPPGSRLSSISSVLCIYKHLKTKKFEELGNFKFVNFPDLIALCE